MTAYRVAAFYGFSVDFVVEAAPHDGCYCNRCGQDGPSNPQRFEQRWDVAKGVELVCPDCPEPGDLDWASDIDSGRR